MMQQVWIVGRVLSEHGNGMVWEFQGVFTTRQEADAACVDGTYFVGPAHLDQHIPHMTVSWLGAYYPLDKDPKV